MSEIGTTRLLPRELQKLLDAGLSTVQENRKLAEKEAEENAPPQLRKSLQGLGLSILF